MTGTDFQNTTPKDILEKGIYDIFTQFCYQNDWWFLIRNFSDDERPFGYLDPEHFTVIPMFTLVQYKRRTSGAPWRFYAQEPYQSLDLGLMNVKDIADGFIEVGLRSIRDIREAQQMGLRVKR
jgi:hypothetical protein